MRYESAQELIEDAAGASEHAPAKLGVRWVFEYLVWLLIISTLVGVFAVAVVSPAFSAVSASVRASQKKGFGRIIMKFSDLPKFTDEIASGILVLSFDKEVNVEPDSVLDVLPDYVGLVRRDPDGKAVRFALKRPFKVNIMEAGLELFIDLLPPDWKGLPPPLPVDTIKALTLKAIEAERRAAEEREQREAAKVPFKLNVHLARHPTFTRLVFDWNKFVTANLTRSGRAIELRFDQYVEADLSQIKADTPKFLRSINAIETHEGMVVQISIDEDVDVRGFREGLDYVVDLTGPEALAQAAAAHVADQVGTKGLPKGIAKSPVPADKKEMAVFSGKREQTESEKSGHNRDAKTVMKDIDPAVLSQTSFADREAESPDVSGKSGDTMRKRGPHPEVGARAAQSQAGPKDEESGVSEKADSSSGGEERETVTAQEDATSTSQASSSSAERARGRVDPEAEGMRFVFRFKKPVAAAVFRRGNSVWAVFDSDAALGLDAMRETASDLVEDIQRVRFGNAQYVRIKLTKPQITHVSHSNNAWHLTIGEMATGGTNSLQLVRTLREDKRSLIKVKMKDHGRVHWITDPEIGDRLAVVTALPPHRSVAKPQEFVDFSAFATAHGIAIRPRTDDVAVRLHLDEVLITRRDGLTLSAGNVGQYAAGRKPLRKAAHAGFIDFAKWKIDSPGELSDRIHELQRRIAEAPQDEMNAKRFDLATLYSSNDLYAESLGILKRMVSVDEDVVLDPAYNALRGATRVMMNRLEEAREDFGVHALANDGDASLWRGLIAAKERNWEEAMRHFRDGADRLKSYRADMEARFRLAGARAALERDKLSEAASALNAVPHEKLPKSIQAEFYLLEGRYREGVGRREEAEELYKLALESGVAPVVAETRLYSTTLDFQSGDIERLTALKELERLQLFWRGDAIELKTNRALASLYVQEKRYHQAFTLMQNSLEAFPNAKIALNIQDDMQEVFKNLFLHGESDQMDPVKALSLYYGHRELTPVGRLGDEMIRRLADRLVSVDLLDQASELLEHQVSKRLSGAARAQVATRLAMVHLMNHKADLALRVLRRTRQAGLPDDLHRRRNLLEARALGELGRSAAAVEILSTMDGESVERLKADAYWAGQEWKNAGRQIEKMLGGRWSEPEPLSDSERFYVLRAAIAYSLSGDQFALDRLQKKYYPKMVKTPDADSFIVVTKPIKDKDVAFRNLAKEIAAIDTLDAFLEEFRAGYDRKPGGKRASSKKTDEKAG